MGTEWGSGYAMMVSLKPKGAHEHQSRLEARTFEWIGEMARKVIDDDRHQTVLEEE